MYKKLKNTKAFTLIELIVVVGIIGILVGIASPIFTGYSKDAKVAAMKTDIETLSNVSMIKDVETGELPLKTGSVEVHEELLAAMKVADASEILSLIDGEKVKGQIKSLSGTYTDYGIIKEGPCKGEVLHLQGVENRRGERIYSYEEDLDKLFKNCNVVMGETPEADSKPGEQEGNEADKENEAGKDGEIDALIKEGYIPIASADELNSLRDEKEQVFGAGTKWENNYTSGLEKSYIQVADLDLSGYESWVPIGDFAKQIPERQFFGVYNGGSYEIKGLNIKGPDITNPNYSNERYVGLFGKVYSAKIENVIITEASIKGNNSVGMLIGDASNTIVNNIYISGEVEGVGKEAGAGNDVGGLIGSATKKSFITGVYSTVNVKSTGASIGGVVGDLQDYGTVLRQAYSEGSVIGTANSGGGGVGGLAGSAGKNATIDYSHFVGTVRGEDEWVGGIVGHANPAWVKFVYTTGEVTGNSSMRTIGAVIGNYVDWTNTTKVRDNYWDKDTATMSKGVGFGDSSGIYGETTSEMKKQSTYKDWDFETVWEINEGVGYPTLRWHNK